MKKEKNEALKKTWTEEEKKKLRQLSNDVRKLYLSRKITREEAKEELKEFVKFYNETSKNIAKKYGMKPHVFCFAAFMR